MCKRICSGILIAMVYLLGQGFASTALAQAAAPEAATQPNLYKVTGQDVHIVYSTTSLSGESRLYYRDKRLSLRFAGDEIRVLATEIGQQITVTLEVVPDSKSVTLTLLIPDINLKNDPIKFKTSAIFTTHHDSIGGPRLVSGQLQSYTTSKLSGEASYVAFLQSGQSSVIGEVTLSPTCPVQRPGQECVKPFAGAAVQLFDASNNPAGSATTNAAGLFAFSVLPGNYTVRISISGRLPRCPDTPVTVIENKSASVLIGCDTGIR